MVKRIINCKIAGFKNIDREIEITSELLDSDMGKTVLEQAKNGVFVRMAVLALILGRNL